MKEKIVPSQEKSADSKEGVVVHQYPEFADWLGQAVGNLSRSRGLLIFFLILLPVATIAYYPTLIDDYDIWWHIKLGEHYVKQMTMTVDHSVFSWTPTDPAWVYNTWLGSTLFYLAYQAAGGFGFWLLQFMCLFGIFLFIFFYKRALKTGFDINVITGIYLIFIALNLTAILYKPENFSITLFAAAVFIYFYSKSTGKNLFYLYPPLFLLWINIHGGFVAGLAFLSIVAAGETFSYLFIKKSRLPRKHYLTLLAAVLLSFLMTLVNPYGYNYPASIVNFMFSAEFSGQISQILAYVSLWQHLFTGLTSFRFSMTAWVMIIYAVLFFGLSIYLYATRRILDVAVLTVGAFFFFMGMGASRYSIFFPIFALFSLLYLLSKLPQDGQLRVKERFAPVAVLLFLVFSVSTLYLNFSYIDKRSWFGQGISDFIPEDAAEFIRTNKLPQPLFNDYLSGGYLIWKLYPDYKVFIDPRYAPYWKEVAPDYMKMTVTSNLQEMKKFFDKYPVQTALIHMSSAGLAVNMVRTGYWRLLYFDHAAAVLIRASYVPNLSAETLKVDAGTARFRNIKSPGALVNLFNFYIQIHPVYGQEILEIFKNNVSGFYKHKKEKILEMQNAINQQREFLLQKQKQAVK